jgi:phage-related minor tail protein
MAAEKKRMRFSTSSTELEEEYESMVQTVKNWKGNWGELLREANVIMASALKVFKAMKEAKDAEGMAVSMNSFSFGLVLRAVGQVGQEISDIHERLAVCEKDIKDIKRRGKS